MKRPPEMSRAQFTAALKRHGWTKQLLWICRTDRDAAVGMVLHMNGRPAYRASLAKAVRAFETDERRPA